jgi:Kef-type K+ transport system membrane component KefB
VKLSRSSGESIADALWMSASAGVAAVLVLFILSGFIYLFDPAGKQIVEKHLSQCLIAAILVFVGVFGITLEMTLTDQFWRGKWK